MEVLGEQKRKVTLTTYQEAASVLARTQGATLAAGATEGTKQEWDPTATTPGSYA